MCLFTLRPKYLDSLYNAVPKAFPINWEYLKRKDPIQAWHSLNQTVIRYMNSAFKDQALQISEDDKPIDNYDLYALTKSINETIEKTVEKCLSDYSETTSTSTKGERDPLSKSKELVTIVNKMEEMMRILQSHTTKVTGRDLYPSPTYTTPGPSLFGIPQTSTTTQTIKGTGAQRMKRDISYDEI